MKRVMCLVAFLVVMSWVCISSAWMGQLTEIVNYTKINGVSVAISESEDSVRTQLVDSQVSLVHG